MQKGITITVFVSGMVSLAVEMAASRLLGNYFGTSNLIWATIIGLILIYLTAGYFLGGAWSDRSPNASTFYQILLWAGLAIGVIPLISRPILRVAANAFDGLQLGAMIGSFIAVLILFSIPVTLLGTASPFAIRLSLHDSRQAGSVSGKIYAISTLGSFIGTFLPGLVLIPLIGTYRTFLAFSLVLILTALIGLGSVSGWRKAVLFIWMPVVIAILAIVGVRGADKTSRGLVYETESAYNYIQVLQQDGYTILRLNEGQGMHSLYHPTQLNYFGPWEQVLVAPFFNAAPYSTGDVHSMAIVGLAAGTTARQASQVYPDIQIDGIEIDPKIVSVARKYFDMNEPNLNVIIQDGRYALSNSQKKYDIISVDAYRPPYIPWHMTTQEFFQTVYDHLNENGSMAINVGRAPNDRRLVNALVGTIRSVFPSVYVMDLPNSFNSIVFATRQPTQAANLQANFSALVQQPQTPTLLVDTMAITVANLQPTPDSKNVFTDDLTSIEWLTNDLVMSYFIGGDLEGLQQ
ncbi:spermidine synthase [Longilinea arvoryzae]|uniref:Spermidine synthase n=1 Tax=Longilinea arvoryzae TaxID=360412 RepID=A0A0S7BLM3_9CHLR|nr:fused MFS/spermidine synthase [Longilinea arvoryzae]GAP15090.1 spermidine synthase [Longilinea arvoryzae]